MKEGELIDDETTEAHEAARAYAAVRDQTLRLIEPLTPEDCGVQSMPDASPVKWHLAHTTWFFERFVLAAHERGHRPFDVRFRDLFNSYYNSVGPLYPRAQRGLLSRPSLSEILDYRRDVDARVSALLTGLDARGRWLVTLGLHHEQQHQELILTDIKHAFFNNPLGPSYVTRAPHVARPRGETAPLRFVAFAGGLYEVGAGAGGFAFDNERPRHRVYVHDFALADRLVTNGEYLAFVQSGGYERPELWLSEGWRWAREQRLSAPLYWREQDGAHCEFTLHGLCRLDLDAPVCHVSYYEAQAYAAYAGARLATEVEWEVAAERAPAGAGDFLESRAFAPQTAGPSREGEVQQLFGEAWQWTQSAYAPYPGYAPFSGALGEYNGKFMCNQLVLRGGSCATPRSHFRHTYRNFFAPEARWQFSGIRLAR